ncbi:MAG: HAD hydrolase family protein [Dysgonomonas sp.]|nr:HAD hydrolase family protein [Dysgonomonas sp.]
MIIAIDFDGTLHTGKYPGIGAASPHAKETMQKLKEEGHYLIIWTCREGVLQTEAVNWLLAHEIPFDRVNDHEPQNKAEYEPNVARKVYADLYIDDKQVGGLPTWKDIYKYVWELTHDSGSGFGW